MKRAKLALWALAAVLALALLAPYIPVGRYRESTRAALESALGRKVQLSDVNFRLLPRPGFTVSNVTIGEDPSIGAEPVAYVNTLRAIPRFTALLMGRLEIASVDLQDASLNLTRVDRESDGVRWNFSALMRPQTLSAFPVVHLRGGRINFKLGDTKSIFYLLNTDLDLSPPATPARPWTLRLHAEPARTDRPARGFGAFLLRGEWRLQDNTVQLDARFEKSELEDVLVLFNGHQGGLQGSISANAHLAGPVNHIGVSGKLALAGLHGFNQAPPGGNEWPLAIGGFIDASSQQVDLTARLDAKQSPVEIRYRASGYLKRPMWAVNATLDKFPLAPFTGVGRNLGWPLPPDLKLDSSADGAIGFTMPEGVLNMTGALTLSNSTISLSGAPPLHIPAAAIQLSGATVSLTPTTLAPDASHDPGHSATLAATFDAAKPALSATLTSDGASLAPLARELALARIPLLGQATTGTWKGSVRYASDTDPSWTGDVHLENTTIPFEAFSDQLLLSSADVSINGADVSLKHLSLSSGGLTAQGEYHYNPSADHPHQFKLTIPTADAAAIEKLTLPALRRGNFFTYAFNFGRTPQPDWLRDMHADGTLQIGALNIADAALTQIQTHVLWDASSLRLTEIKARWAAATVSGVLTADLSGRDPAYEAEGNIRNFAWRSGTVGAEVSLSTSGTGAELLNRLRAKGALEAKSLDLSPATSVQSLSGPFELTMDSKGPRLRSSALTAGPKGAELQGTAEPADNGHVILKLAGRQPADIALN